MSEPKSMLQTNHNSAKTACQHTAWEPALSHTNLSKIDDSSMFLIHPVQRRAVGLRKIRREKDAKPNARLVPQPLALK